ncbi:MAG: ABC transporter permease [Desulfobacterales bacterium]|nr:ABC transporter permease [Desulfobacterales bacterium]
MIPIDSGNSYNGHYFLIGCKADRPGNPDPNCHLNHLFIGVEALPGDLAEEILGSNALPETVAAFRKELKLDLPPHERYVAWLGDLLKGDLGKSLANGRPVVDLIGGRFANTVFLHLPCSFRPQVKS